jgi:hypothetical protein
MPCQALSARHPSSARASVCEWIEVFYDAGAGTFIA